MMDIIVENDRGGLPYGFNDSDSFNHILHIFLCHHYGDSSYKFCLPLILSYIILLVFTLHSLLSSSFPSFSTFFISTLVSDYFKGSLVGKVKVGKSSCLSLKIGSFPLLALSHSLSLSLSLSLYFFSVSNKHSSSQLHFSVI